MKATFLTFAILLAFQQLSPAQTNTLPLTDSKPLPPVEFLLQKVVERATNVEDKNDNLFDMNYQYTRTRVWEYRNSTGELKSREEKSSVENKAQRMAERAARLAAGNQQSPPPTPTPTTKDGPVTDTHSNIRGKALKVKDYSIPNLVKRFQFTLVGREMLNGRPSLVVDFKPASNELPVNGFADKFINKAAGRVWIDEEEYAIVQAQLRLTEKVNVLGGVVGSVWKFNYTFTRLRTPEGFWFCRQMDWHLEGREVVINRIVDYHERKLNEQKITAPGSKP